MFFSHLEEDTITVLGKGYVEFLVVGELRILNAISQWIYFISFSFTNFIYRLTAGHKMLPAAPGFSPGTTN